MRAKEEVSIASSSGTPSSRSRSSGTGDRPLAPPERYGFDGGGDGANSEPWKYITCVIGYVKEQL